MRTSEITSVILFAFVAVLSGSVAGEDREAGGLFAPYAAQPDHIWNKLHRALFVRELSGDQLVHKTDPLLYRGGTFLFAGDSHRKAVAALDEFLAKPADPPIDNPVPRLFLQRDLWGAFDYAAWYPDDWVLKSEYEPGAIAIRTRLAKAIAPLTLSQRELAALPDNYAQAIKSKAYASEYDRDQPTRPFLPPDLFDEQGNWVRFQDTTVGVGPMTRKHLEGAGRRAAHIVFLRVPEGRAATEQYLKELKTEAPILERLRRPAVKQFPEGTMTAMVRRPLAIDQSRKLRVTPVTELVQIRVYRRIPQDPEANLHGDFGEQDVYEFLLDRSQLFAGEHGLQAVGPGDRSEPDFGRTEMSDPFERASTRTREMRQLKTCIQCHQAPGIYSMLSMDRALRTDANSGGERFPTYAWDVELKLTVRAKTQQYNWECCKGCSKPGEEWPLPRLRRVLPIPLALKPLAWIVLPLQADEVADCWVAGTCSDVAQR
jgi:hypothetical protein